MTEFPRASGVLLHPTSLTGRFGIGELGDEAYVFVDWLAKSGQSYWQVLPLGPTGYGDSPYQCFSSLAGNPLLVSLKRLAEDGLLTAEELDDVSPFPHDRVDFGPVIEFKWDRLNRAVGRFRSHASLSRQAEFDAFCSEHGDWLDDFALFMALKYEHGGAPWNTWEPEFATRRPEALQGARERLSDGIFAHKVVQFYFFAQWAAVKRYANSRGIEIIGDIPIYVAMDSADAWANQPMFRFDEHGQPTEVAGVPPDYFSTTGQLWGNPLYRWGKMADNKFAWWIQRFRLAFTQCDILRVDHFRGFHNFWVVPAGAETAVNGQWEYGPGATLFRVARNALGPVRIIAEDLGEFTPESRAAVDALREEFDFPGMKVLQFAFGSGPKDLFLPHNYKSLNWVVYTGTHDNDTTRGWWEVTSAYHERDYARRYLKSDGSDIVWDLIRLAWASVASTAMVPFQDLLNLGHEARMNAPSVLGPPNWMWRLPSGALTDDLAARLRSLTEIYGRLPAPPSGRG
jgi:4-alpha-glucanotransferase